MIGVYKLRRNISVGLQFYRGYLSSNFQNVVNKGLETCSNYKDIDQLLAMRWRKLGSNALESSNFAVISYFMKSGNADDLVTIVSNRLEYGVFLTPFTACYLMDYFLKQKNYAAATQMVKELIAIDRLEGEIVCALALKSCYEYIKTGDLHNFPEEAPTGEEKEVKVRVKYLRNPPPEDPFNQPKLTKKVVSQSILAVSNTFQDSIKSNMEILSAVLCEDYKTVTELLNSKNGILFKDVHEVCLDLVKNNTDVQKSLQEVTISEQSFADTLDTIIKNTVQKEERNLFENQELKYPLWNREWEMEAQTLSEQRSKMERKNAIEATLKEIEERRQRLWFFELEDKLDLEIYNKIPKYPKRWFGKKKKPRVVDENYVPPEITRK